MYVHTPTVYGKILESKKEKNERVKYELSTYLINETTKFPVIKNDKFTFIYFEICDP